MRYRQNDINLMLSKYQAENNASDRYASFDYCYHYFYPSSSRDLLVDIEKSCLILGFYLASWGMFRGSSFLLQKSAKYFEPIILYIANQDTKVWSIDIDNYTQENIGEVCKIYKEVKDLVIKNDNSHLILVSKIMLGVFGVLPAFDQYFCNAFRSIFKKECGFRSVSLKSIICIKDFYEQNKDHIDNMSQNIYVKDFSSWKDTSISYPKAKIIDMYGFSKGFLQMEKEKEKELKNTKY